MMIVIRVPAQRVATILRLTIISLTVASIAGQLAASLSHSTRLARLVPLLHLGMEANLPTWYASASLLLCSLLLVLIALIARGTGDRLFPHWLSLSLIFLMLSMDETAHLHEKMILPLRSALNATGLFYYTWVLPGIGVVAICAVTYRRLIQSLPSRIGCRFLIAAVLYVGGAIGIEMVGAWYASRWGEADFAYNALSTVEEVLEMLGVLVFIHALMAHIGALASPIGLSFSSTDIP